MTRTQWLGAAVIMLGSFVPALDGTIVSTVMPTVVQELGGLDRYSWVFSTYLLVSTVATPLFGRVADIYGRKPLYLAALAVFVGGSMLAGASRDMTQLIAFRAVQGLGAGMLLPTGLTIIGDLFDYETRAKVQGLFSSVWAIGAISGPTIGGFITETFSWRWAFYVNLPIGVAAAALVIVGLRETVGLVRQPIDWGGAVVFTAATLSLMLGLNGVIPLATLPLALVLAVAFVRIERGRDAPLIDLTLPRIPIVRAGIALNVVIGILMYGFITFLPQEVQFVLGGRPLEAGLSVSVMNLGWPLGSTLSGWLLLSIGLRRLTLAGAALTVVGTALLIALGPGAPVALAFAASAILGLGNGFIVVGVLVTAQSAVGVAQRGVVTGLVLFARNLGAAVGVAGLGAILTRAADGAALGEALHLVFVVMLAIAAAGAVLAWVVPARSPAPAVEPEEALLAG